MSSQPIRVGIIGLGISTGTLSPGIWATIAHLPYLLSSPKYTITAVTNSTISSAQRSISHHNLGSHVKAYDNPQDLASDPNVDLIVICVKVQKHYELAKPAVLAGKSVFVEWPLASTTEEARELAQLAQTHGSRTMVGLQARASPLVKKLRHLISSNTIGKVLSSTVTSTFGGLPPFWPQGAEYYLSMSSGGNTFTIYFAHFLDSLTDVLGPFESISSSTMRNDFPTIDVVDSAGNVAHKAYEKDTPDYISVQGTLRSGASASIVFTTSPPGPDGSRKAIDGKGLRWLIVGTEGQIEVTTEERQWQMSPPGTTLRLQKDGKVEDVVFEGDLGEVHAVEKTGLAGRNTGRVYEAFVEGRIEDYADFEGAVEMHELLDAIRGKAGW